MMYSRFMSVDLLEVSANRYYKNAKAMLGNNTYNDEVEEKLVDDFDKDRTFLLDALEIEIGLEEELALYLSIIVKIITRLLGESEEKFEEITELSSMNKEETVYTMRHKNENGEIKSLGYVKTAKKGHFSEKLNFDEITSWIQHKSVQQKRLSADIDVISSLDKFVKMGAEDLHPAIFEIETEVARLVYKEMTVIVAQTQAKHELPVADLLVDSTIRRLRLRLLCCETKESAIRIVENFLLTALRKNKEFLFTVRRNISVDQQTITFYDVSKSEEKSAVFCSFDYTNDYISNIEINKAVLVEIVKKLSKAKSDLESFTAIHDYVYNTDDEIQKAFKTFKEEIKKEYIDMSKAEEKIGYMFNETVSNVLESNPEIGAFKILKTTSQYLLYKMIETNDTEQNEMIYEQIKSHTLTTDNSIIICHFENPRKVLVELFFRKNEHVKLEVYIKNIADCLSKK